MFTDIAHSQKSGDIQQNIWRAEKNILRAILMSDVEQKNPKLSKNQFRNKIGSLRLADFDKKIQLGGDGER